jgi:hypothetical protein
MNNTRAELLIHARGSEWKKEEKDKRKKGINK